MQSHYRSRSPWSFPVVIVDKKAGSRRFCVDFRKLNQVPMKNSYPLPVIDEILALILYFPSFKEWVLAGLGE